MGTDGLSVDVLIRKKMLEITDVCGACRCDTFVVIP